MREEYFMTFSEMDVVRYVFLRWISSHKATTELMLVAFSEPNDLLLNLEPKNAVFAFTDPIC